MAYLRTANNDGVGDTYLRVLVDGLTGNSYSNITIYNATTGQVYYASYEGAGRSTVQTFTGLSPGTNYSFYAMVTPTGSTARRVPDSGFDSFSTTGVSDNPPTVSITSISGENAISLSWSAYDDWGLRPGSPFALYLSGPDSSALQFREYTSNYSRIFQNDGFGSPLKPNSVYLVRVVAIDSSNQTGYAERYITFKKARPANFIWTYSKASGGQYNLTPQEWNALLNKINEFREYKGFIPFDFNRTITNGAINSYVVPSAAAFNSAVNGINSLSPTLSPPAQVNSGSIVTANQLNRLRDSLNSVA
jgi:hypothetical protein